MGAGASRHTTGSTTGSGFAGAVARLCKKTFTILPAWSPPSWPLQLLLPAEASESEQCRAAVGSNPPLTARTPTDCRMQSTLRRWACRKLISLWFWMKTGLRAKASPTLFSATYHPCLGLCSRRPYSAPGGKFAMKCQAAETLKQQIPLLDYVEGQDWQPVRRIAGGRLMGLCPLHADRKPSFLLDPNKNLFYCYGCGRGGDVIRFAELFTACRSLKRFATTPLVGRGLVAERRDQVLPGSAPSSSGSGCVSRCSAAYDSRS